MSGLSALLLLLAATRLSGPEYKQSAQHAAQGGRVESMHPGAIDEPKHTILASICNVVPRHNDRVAGTSAACTADLWEPLFLCIGMPGRQRNTESRRGLTHKACVQGIPLVDVPHLLAPAMLSWITVVGVKLESVAASYVAADSQAPPPHAWAPVSRVQGFLCSASLVDTFHAVGTSVDVIAARAIVAQPRAIAVRAAEALAAATGGAVRVCAAATEAAALADLRPAAQAAAAAGCLPPSGHALLSAHVDSIAADGAPAAAEPADNAAAREVRTLWFPTAR